LDPLTVFLSRAGAWGHQRPWVSTETPCVIQSPKHGGGEPGPSTASHTAWGGDTGDRRGSERASTWSKDAQPELKWFQHQGGRQAEQPKSHAEGHSGPRTPCPPRAQERPLLPRARAGGGREGREGGVATPLIGRARLAPPPATAQTPPPLAPYLNTASLLARIFRPSGRGGEFGVPPKRRSPKQGTPTSRPCVLGDSHCGTRARGAASGVPGHLLG
jgi:hypothetical protein